MEDMPAIMREVTRELAPLLRVEDVNREALNTLLWSISNLMSHIFYYLPEEEQSHVLVNCGTWLCVGILAGREPQKLSEIMDRVNPSIEEVECPSWMSRFLRDLTGQKQD